MSQQQNLKPEEYAFGQFVSPQLKVGTQIPVRSTRRAAASTSELWPRWIHWRIRRKPPAKAPPQTPAVTRSDQVCLIEGRCGGAEAGTHRAVVVGFVADDT
jgi:hypothetical protein